MGGATAEKINILLILKDKLVMIGLSRQDRYRSEIDANRPTFGEPGKIVIK